jgi:large subunit ribosomal protein L14e
MASLVVGRVVMKVAGREGGRYAVIIKAAGQSKEEKSFVTITGPKLLTGVKRRKCNIEHLEPTEYLIEIKEDAAEEEVLAAFDKAGLVTKFDLKRPSAAEVKAEKAKPAKEEKPKEKAKREEKKEEKPKRKIKFKIGGGKEKEEKKEVKE